MTPAADQLREQAAALIRAAEEQAAQMRRLADHLAGETPLPAQPEWLNTAEAERVSGYSRTQLYRWARQYGIGEQLPSGAWRFNRPMLIERALTASQRGLGANGASMA